jgi:hypothetical protein
MRRRWVRITIVTSAADTAEIMKKTMSAKQIAANQANAQRSTGPKTLAGRAVSKMNAVKHGILSKEVLVRGLNRKENSREYMALHQRFRNELNPVGPVEEMLVDQIVTTHWRLRRALIAESGEIALSVDEGQWKRRRGPNPHLQWLQWEALGAQLWSMVDTVEGNGILESWLGEVRTSVEQHGELTEAAIQKLVQHFGGKSNGVTTGLENFRLKLQKNPEGLEAAALRERNKTQALAFLNQELGVFNWQKRKCVERDDNEEQARQAAAVLPSMDVLEKILRYETKLERQLYRAMTHLERFQRMRQGEAVPPPMTMEVSGGA